MPFLVRTTLISAIFHSTFYKLNSLLDTSVLVIPNIVWNQRYSLKIASHVCFIYTSVLDRAKHVTWQTHNKQDLHVPAALSVLTTPKRNTKSNTTLFIPFPMMTLNQAAMRRPQVHTGCVNMDFESKGSTDSLSISKTTRPLFLIFLFSLVTLLTTTPCKKQPW